MLIVLLVPVLVAALYIAVNVCLTAAENFISVNKPIPNAEVLVVEGWLFPWVLPHVKKEFEDGSYKYIITSGKILDPHSMVNKDTSYALRAARNLIALGLDPSIIKPVEAPLQGVIKTLSSAVAVRNWLAQNDPKVTRINVCTIRYHARKTRCSFERAFGPSMKIGVVALPHRTLAPADWIHFQGNPKLLLRYLAGYFYVRFAPLNDIR
jgi:hypothetical protein